MYKDTSRGEHRVFPARFLIGKIRKGRGHLPNVFRLYYKIIAALTNRYTRIVACFEIGRIISTIRSSAVDYALLGDDSRTT